MSNSLFGFLRGTKNIQIGIDVGATAVKVAAIEHSSNGLKLLGLGWEETPPGAIVDGALNDTKAITTAVKAALEQTNIRYKGANATIGLRGINVVFKKLSVPFQGISELPKQIILEAQQHVDSDLEQWQIDYEPIGAPNNEGQIAILLVAARKAVVEEYTKMLSIVGVLPSVVDCDAFAISNSFEQSTGSDATTNLCVDVGKDSTKIHLTIAGQSSIIRSLPVGGSHFTDLIARQINISHEEAETLKWGLSDPDYAAGHQELLIVCKQHIDELCDEIKKTMDFYSGYETQIEAKNIDSIVLSGGGSVAPGLSEGISKMLNADTVYAHPFQNMKLNPKIDPNVTSRYAHQFAVAAGLALRKAGDRI
jgi:type IV pilus assembly protein PilM